jgi:Protein of unknown function (DUF3237)
VAKAMSTMTARQPAIETEHVFDYHASLKPPVAIGAGPYGNRLFYEALGGRVSGPRVNGEVLGGGGDWALIGPDGWTRLDVRGQCRTDDGALLYFTYRGLIEPNKAVLEAVGSGGETAFADQYFRISLEVETGDRRYAWLTQTALIGRGRICSGPGVAYEVFRIR